MDLGTSAIPAFHKMIFPGFLWSGVEFDEVTMSDELLVLK
jgi:hypothetical protein